LLYPESPILGDDEESGGHEEMWRWRSLPVNGKNFFKKF
jgi:hypothetical protein